MADPAGTTVANREQFAAVDDLADAVTGKAGGNVAWARAKLMPRTLPQHEARAFPRFGAAEALAEFAFREQCLHR